MVAIRDEPAQKLHCERCSWVWPAYFEIVRVGLGEQECWPPFQRLRQGIQRLSYGRTPKPWIDAAGLWLLGRVGVDYSCAMIPCRCAGISPRQVMRCLSLVTRERTCRTASDKHQRCGVCLVKRGGWAAMA